MQNAAHTTLELKTEERQRCEVWTRVMGYHRPVSEFNPVTGEGNGFTFSDHKSKDLLDAIKRALGL